MSQASSGLPAQLRPQLLQRLPWGVRRDREADFSNPAYRTIVVTSCGSTAK
jgi:hypothetical protein